MFTYITGQLPPDIAVAERTPSKYEEVFSKIAALKPGEWLGIKVADQLTLERMRCAILGSFKYGTGNGKGLGTVQKKGYLLSTHRTADGKTYTLWINVAKPNGKTAQ